MKLEARIEVTNIDCARCASEERRALVHELEWLTGWQLNVMVIDGGSAGSQP